MDDEPRERYVQYEKVICVICNKKIRSFKNRDDWKKRLMHLKCWKDDQETMKMNSIFENFLKET
jgi:hypothetical protein